MLIDLLFTAGTIGFLSADVKQFWKLHSNKYQTKAISRTHLKLKMFSLACVCTAYYLSGLSVSLFVASTQFLLTVGITYYVYRRYNY